MHSSRILRLQETGHLVHWKKKHTAKRNCETSKSIGVAHQVSISDVYLVFIGVLLTGLTTASIVLVIEIYHYPGVKGRRQACVIGVLPRID